MNKKVANKSKNNSNQVYTFDQFAQKLEKLSDGQPIIQKKEFQKPISDLDLKEFKDLLDDKQYKTITAKQKLVGKTQQQVQQQKRLLDLERFVNSDDEKQPPVDNIRAHKQ